MTPALRSNHVEARVHVDARALREELALPDPVDIHSNGFMRFVIRLSERLNVDLPDEHHPRLSTVAGSVAYVDAIIARN